ncbi:MAG: DUF5678 domain-containing protein [Candidatus Woesearchaeota archaeon]
MMESYANYEWFLKNDFKDYSGKWLAIIDKKVVASGDNVNIVIKKTKEKYPNKKPFITKIKEKLSIL